MEWNTTKGSKSYNEYLQINKKIIIKKHASKDVGCIPTSLFLRVGETNETKNSNSKARRV